MLTGMMPGEGSKLLPCHGCFSHGRDAEERAPPECFSTGRLFAGRKVPVHYRAVQGRQEPGIPGIEIIDENDTAVFPRRWFYQADLPPIKAKRQSLKEALPLFSISGSTRCRQF
jgi:hypothetical protein